MIRVEWGILLNRFIRCGV